MREEYIGCLDDDWNTILDQSQPIVRCRDCRYCKPYEAMKVEGYKCTRVSTCFAVEPDGFCAWGERP